MKPVNEFSMASDETKNFSFFTKRNCKKTEHRNRQEKKVKNMDLDNEFSLIKKYGENDMTDHKRSEGESGLETVRGK